MKDLGSEQLPTQIDKNPWDEPTADGCSPADKVTGMGKKRMLQRVGEVARVSVGCASNALALLKLDAAELNLLSPDEMFNTILEAAKKIPQRGVRDTVMIAIFDMEGMALIGEDEREPMHVEQHKDGD